MFFNKLIKKKNGETPATTQFITQQLNTAILPFKVGEGFKMY